MSKVSAVWRTATSWYVSLIFLAAIGIFIGYFVFFEVYPGKPKIGVIDIPFTVITDDSAFTISAFLEYARLRDDIKGVVIKLNSPGGGASASEQLFMETHELREKKPVVIVMNDIVASGGYMMSLGANYTFAKGATEVGSVGVVLTFPGPLIPDLPSENVVTSAVFKRRGGTRRDWIGTVEQLKQGFAQMVLAERGDRLRISLEELTQARVYPGIEGVRLGLVDEIGGDTQGLEKAASLAGISRYDLVDVNTEVLRIFFEKLARILEPLPTDAGGQPSLADIAALIASSRATGDSSLPLNGVTSMNMLRRLSLTSGIDQIQEQVPPDFPLNISKPKTYYLYVGPSQ